MGHDQPWALFHEMASLHNRRRMWGHWHALHLTHQNSQRLGDLAAGTMVIKLTDIRKIHISLDEFYYAKKDYHPVYEEAKNLSQAQVAVIEKALYSSNDNHENQIETLADKVAKFLKVQPKENSKEKFLATILYDYNYYLMELI